MHWLLSLLPGIGDVAKGVTDYLNKKQDTALEKYKVDGVVNTEAMRQDTEVIKARADLAKATAGDPVNRWGRRLFVYPTGVWYTVILYDSTFRALLPDWATWRPLAIPSNLDYIPYAIIAYLFVTAWRGK